MRDIRTRSLPVLKDRRTVIASADRVLITALTHLFEGIGPLVGAATSEQDALNCLKANDVQLLVCTDLLEHGSGTALVAAAKAQHPKLRCLMLIQRPLLSTIDAAIASGCEGLCSRERLGDGGVLSVLQAMDSDGIHMDPTITGVCQHSRRRPSQGMAPPLSDVLTLREEDVLRGLCRGLSNQEIADQLHLAVDTIKHAVTSLLRKLEARDRTQAVLVAFQHNLVDPPAPIPRWQPRTQR